MAEKVVKMRALVLSGVIAAITLVGASSALAKGSGPPPVTVAPLDASNLGSGTTAYSNAADFSAAVSNVVTDGFENIATPTSGGIGNVAYPTGIYTDANGTTFSTPVTGSVYDLNILDKTYLNGAGQAGKFDGTAVLTTNHGVLTIDLAKPTDAFGIDFAATGNGFAALTAADTFTFTVDGQGYATEGSPTSGVGFFGFTSSTPFDQIAITQSSINDNQYFDNVSSVVAASASAVPEPSTWLLMIAGIGGIGLMLRRAKQTMGFKLKDAFTA